MKLINNFIPHFSLYILSLVVCGFSYSASANESPVAEPLIKGEVVQQAQQLISINRADPETLAASLKGIGQKKALAIVEWREANGGFKSLEQLLEVKGIGNATLEKNRHLLTL